MGEGGGGGGWTPIDGPPVAPPLAPTPGPPLRAPPPSPQAPPPSPGGGSNGVWAVGIILLILAVAVLVVLVVEPGDDEPDERAEPTTLPDRPRPTTTRPTTTTSTSTTTTTPPPTEPPPPPPLGFEEGTWLVGQDIQPGRYITDGAFACYWERRSAVGNGLDGVIVNGNAAGQVIIDIGAGDVAFMSSGCPRWIAYAPPPAPVTTFGPGDWAVGDQVVPGTYTAAQPTELCYWERESGFTHEIGASTDNSFHGNTGPATVTLRAGQRFTSESCGDWVLG